MKKIKLTFLIPAYNEEKVLEYGTKIYVDYLEKLEQQNKDFDYEAILCLNGCTDNTEKIAKKICKNNKKISYVVTDKGFGKGLNAGILKADGDIITFGNADAELLPDFLDEGIELMADRDFVLGSRYLSKKINHFICYFINK